MIFKKFILIFLISFSLFIVFFHDYVFLTLSGWGIKYYTSKQVGEALSYDRLSWEGDTLVISNPYLKKNQFQASSIYLNYNFNWLSRQLDVRLTVNQPHWEMGGLEVSQKAWKSLLKYKKPSFFKINTSWKVNDGQLKWHSEREEKALFFKMEFDSLAGGYLNATFDQALAKDNQFNVELASSSDALFLKWDCSHLSCSSWLKLIQLFYPAFKSLHVESGLVEGKILAVFPIDKRPYLSGEMQLENFSFNHLGIQIQGLIKKAKLKLNENTNSIAELGWSLTTIGYLDVLEPSYLASYESEKELWRLDNILGGFTLNDEKIVQLAFNADCYHQSDKIKLNLQGLANLNSRKSFNIEMNLSCATQNHPYSNIQFVINQAKGALKVAEIRFDQLSYVEWNYLQTLLSSSWPALKKVKLLDGSLNALLFAEFSKSGFEKVDCQYIAAENLKLEALPWNAVLICPKWIGQATFDLSQKNIWDTLTAEVLVDEGEIAWEKLKDHHITDIKTKISINQGNVQHSQIKMEWSGLKGIVDIEWSKYKKLISANFLGKTDHLIPFIPTPLQKALKLPFENQNLGVIANISADSEGFNIDGNLHVQRSFDSLQQDLIHFGGKLKKDFSLADSNESPIGWFNAKDLPLEKFLSPVIFKKGNATIHGRGEFIGNFDFKKVSMKYRTQDLQIVNEDLQIDIKELVIDSHDAFPGMHVFDIKSGSHEGFLPVKLANYLEKNTGLLFENMSTFVSFKDETICFNKLESTCKGIFFSGSLDLDYSDPKPGVFSVELKIPSLVGKISQVQAMLLHLDNPQPLARFPLEGDVETHGKGLYLKFDFVPKDYALQAEFDGEINNGCMDLSNANMAIQELYMDVKYRHAAQSLEFNDIQGSLLVGKPRQAEEYFITGQYLRFQDLKKQNVEVDLGIANQNYSLMHIVGHSEIDDKSNIKVHVDKAKTHLFSIFPEKFDLQFYDWSNIALFEMEANVKIANIWKNLSGFLIQSGLFFPQKFLDKIHTIHRTQGNYQIFSNFNSKESALCFELKGQEVSFNNTHFQEVGVKGKKLNDKWLIDQFQIDQLALSGEFEHVKNEWKFDFLSFNFGPSCLVGMEGSFLEEEGKAITTIHLLEADLDVFDKEKTPFEYLKQWNLKGKISGKGSLNIEFLDHYPWFQVETKLQTTLNHCEIQGLPIDIIKPFSIHYESNKMAAFSDLSCLVKHQLQEDVRVNVKDIKFDVPQSALKISNLDLTIPVNSSTQLVDLLKIHFPDYIEDSLKEILTQFQSDQGILANLNIQKEKDKFHVLGEFKDGNYTFKGHLYPLKNFTVEVDPNIVSFSAFSLYERCPFYFKGYANFPQLDEGNIILVDQKKGVQNGLELIIDWKKGPNDSIIFRSLNGYFCGLNFFLEQSSSEIALAWSSLKGQIEIDFEHLKPLLSKETEQTVIDSELGSHYILSGLFSINASLGKELSEQLFFDGYLSAQNTVFKGKFVESIKSAMSYSPSRLDAKKFTISDPAGTLLVEEAFFTKDQATQNWFFSIPTLAVKNLRPSQLRDVQENGSSSFKSLLIRRAEFNDISGKLNDVHTWQGNGYLHFLNPSRKNYFHPLFAIPAEIILRLGLDPYVLNPVTGTIQFTLNGDRFYFTKFKDVFSEGRGSKFYLADSQLPSWMDMKGNLFVQIRMKQYNLIFKIAELFTVSIQGNIKKPRYSLTRQEKN